VVEHLPGKWEAEFVSYFAHLFIKVHEKECGEERQNDVQIKSSGNNW
jgi:hypothetical protein